MSEAGLCSTRPATFGASGETTAFPEIQTVISGINLSLESVNFVALPANGERDDLVRVFAQVRNAGSSRVCLVQLDMSLGGFTESAGLAGPQYQSQVSGIGFACLDPGDQGVISSRFFMTEAELLEATTLRITRTNDEIAGLDEVRYDVVTVTDQRIVEAEGGYQLVQTVTADRQVVNYYQDVYAVDARGLLFAELDVPDFGPDSGGALLQPSQPQELVSEIVPCEIVDFVLAGEHYFEN